MSHHRSVSAHPLDTELADFVEGTLDATSARRVEDHLAHCLLCRVKRQRFIGHAPFEFTGLRDAVIPDFVRIDSEPESVANAGPGELWLAGDGESEDVMVLIRAVGDHGVVVVPVTLDVDVADNETLVVGASASPLGFPLAVYEHLRVSLPTSVLTRRIVPIRVGVNLLTITDTDDGISHGSPIEGPADPRLEIRQYLSDRLTVLNPPSSEPSYPLGEESLSSEELLRRLRSALNDIRSDAIVDPLEDLRTAAATMRDWVGIARVEEFNVVVHVIDTPAGLNDSDDFLAAHALITRLSGSALAVCTTGLSENADLYDASGLFGAIQLPDGERVRGPLIANLPARDLITKFLDQKITVPLGTVAMGQRGSHVDVDQVLADQVVAAVQAVVETGRNAHIRAKAEGYVAVGESAESLTETLRAALRGSLDPERVANLAEEEER